MVLIVATLFGPAWVATSFLLLMSEALASMKAVKSNSLCQCVYYFLTDLQSKKVLSIENVEVSVAEALIHQYVPPEQQDIINTVVNNMIVAKEPLPMSVPTQN